MSAKTTIEWTAIVHPDGTVTPGATWNPVTGCSKVSLGCTNCYAEALSTRFRRTTLPWTARNAAENVRLHPDRLGLPLRWRAPRRVFVNSMSDLFHEQVPFDFVQRVFEVMAEAERHTFLILTKRPERMRTVLIRLYEDSYLEAYDPLPNVWIGVSAENQRRADERIPLLVKTPAAIRFLSCEPLLGPIDLARAHPCGYYCDDRYWPSGHVDHGFLTPGRKPKIDWVIAGGESGSRFRPMELDWARSIRDQCQAASVPFFFKQISARSPGRGEDALDGRIWHEMPRHAAPAEVSRV